MNPHLAPVRITVPSHARAGFLAYGLQHGIGARLAGERRGECVITWPRPTRLHLLTDWAARHGLQVRLQPSGGLRLVPRATAARAA